ncbi:MAG: methionine adenosyltransferase domain-containing protein, partial [Alphaproteobacteria bacterium]
QPISIFVDCDGTAEADEAAIARALGQTMDLSPRGIREHLGLTRPIYARSAAYGHFGRTPDADGGFSWERTDLAEALKRAVA